MAAYNRLPKIVYNEFDEKAAAWLRELIRRGLIAPGDVDTRSIVDVRPDDLRGYTQCHFFAGIGVWSYALRRAGWPDDRPVWTGSPPCQPFSAAGKGLGTADERHLWPAFFHLIDVCRPDTFFGEQVASKDGLAWLDLVSSDLEASGYAAGAADTCAAGFGAPHIRQRLYWCALADADNSGLEGRGQPRRRRAGELVAGPGGLAGGLALSDDAFWRTDLPRRDVSDGADAGRTQGSGDARTCSSGDRLGDTGLHGYSADSIGRATCEGENLGRVLKPQGPDTDRAEPGPTNGHWGDVDWLLCRDGKWRPVEPGTFPLAHGAPARVGRLRGYGNAIVAQVAEGFIASYLEAEAADFDLGGNGLASGCLIDCEIEDLLA